MSMHFSFKIVLWGAFLYSSPGRVFHSFQQSSLEEETEEKEEATIEKQSSKSCAFF